MPVISSQSFFFFLKGRYRVLGRVVHLRTLKEKLQTEKNLNFEPSREEINLINQIDILADTVYIEVKNCMSLFDHYIYQ